MSRMEMDEIGALKTRVAELEQKIEFLYRALNLQYNADPTEVNPKITDAIRRGNMIEAIKLYREQTGVGLKEAKDAVEAMAGHSGTR